MASFAQWKDIEAIARAVESAKPRLIHVVREIWLHGFATERSLCPCKCGSREAVRVEIRPHLEVLIDRITGVRRVRRPHNAEAFDRVAAKAERIEMPCRCYGEQLDPILDRKHKVIGIFGGVRAGKSQAGVEVLVDQWCEYGGKGTTFWWVSPTREMTQIAVDKLARGERTNRFVRPAFPRELVRYFPKTEHSNPQAVILIDGSYIPLKYAGLKGKNLKGRVARLVVLDEAAEVVHKINWTILLGRVMESGGQLVAPTTPIAGHWLQELADTGTPYHALQEPDDEEAVTVTLSCMRNPWINQREIQRAIKANGGPDDPTVKREYFGLWVPQGNILWQHWNARKHQIEGVGSKPEDFGYVNVTPIATDHFLPAGARNDLLGGWDCNDYPQSLVLSYVVVKPGQEQGNPANWILLVIAEIVKKATIVEWGEHLSTVKMRGKPENWIRRLSIVGDANTSYEDTRVNRRGQGADADVLRSHGFVVVPPAWTQASPDKPACPMNPGIRDRIKILHTLMHSDRFRIVGSACPKLMDAIISQTCDEKGLPVKVSGKASDRLSGPADGLGYKAYRIWHGAPSPDRKRVQQWQ